MGAPVYRLPPYRVESVVSASELGQRIDWGLSAYGVPEAWKHSRGKGVRVAVLDTGADLTHPDLNGVEVAWHNFTDSAGNGSKDRQGHGTHVAGVIAAVDNAIGVVGLCPGLTESGGGLIVGKVLGDDGSGDGAWVAAGIRWAVEQRADVISMSLGSPQEDRRIRDAVNHAVAAGVFVVCAAGNSGPGNSEVDFPARWPETLAVASVRKDGQLSDFSSRGKRVDLSAPGEKILSTYPGGRYATLSGTSMATPFVAGLVALLIARHRELGAAAKTPLATLADLVEHLKRHATDLGQPGWDTGHGWGVVNVDKAVAGIGEKELENGGPAGEYRIGGLTIHVPSVAGDSFSVGF